MLKDKGYDLPSKIFDEQLDVDATMKRVKEKIKRSEDYERNEKELPYFKDYLSRLEHIKAAPKYIGDGIRRYKQPKRNAYKITNNQYGGLLIDVPSLMNRMKWNAYRGRGGGGGKLVYQADADRSLGSITSRCSGKWGSKTGPLRRRKSNLTDRLLTF